MFDFAQIDRKERHIATGTAIGISVGALLSWSTGQSPESLLGVLASAALSFGVVVLFGALE